MLVNNKQGMGDLLPCCDPSVGFFSAIFSNSCSYCTAPDQAASQVAISQFGQTGGVPNCDPNAGFFSNAFSNSCNLANPIGSALGLPGIPDWVWLIGGGALALFVLKR